MGISRSLWDYRSFIQQSRAEFRRRQAHLRRDAVRGGSAIARSAPGVREAGPRPGHGWTAHLPNGDGLLAFRTRPRRWPASTASTATTSATPGARVEIATNISDARRVAATVARRGLRMSAPLRIAHVAPVARPFRRPSRIGRVDDLLLTEGLVARGHNVTLFATADSTTSAHCLPSTRTAIGTTRICGPGSCTRC